MSFRKSEDFITTMSAEQRESRREPAMVEKRPLEIEPLKRSD